MRTTLALLFLLASLAFCGAGERRDPDRYAWTKRTVAGKQVDCYCMYLSLQKNQPQQFIYAITFCVDCPRPGPLRIVSNGLGGMEIECPIEPFWESWFWIVTGLSPAPP